MKPCYLGIDTSNYTTSLAICDTSGEVVANLKRPLTVKEGERGLRQSDAVFLHVRNLPLLFEDVKALFREYSPVAVGVSAYPRTVEGSYMPCFLAGKSSAYSIGSVLNIPVYEFSHQNGHIMAAIYSSEAPRDISEREFLAFHVSGGTTEALRVKPHEGDFRCELIGGTLDMNAGQAIDRVGVAMGLSFPCGPEMERLALELGDKRSPGIKVSVKNGNCNLSGLENKAIGMFEQSGDRQRTAKFVLDFIAETLARITEDVRAKYPSLPVVYSGGVMSCSIIQKRLTSADTYFAKPQFSADNAAGISLLARRAHTPK